MGPTSCFPLVAAITSVGYDHTDVLGSTIEAIAFEKAGIAKPGVPLVLAVVARDPLAVIERYAAEVGAPLVYVSEAARRAAAELRLRTLGGFQRANAATAIAVLERIDDDLRPTRAETARALEELDIPGRMERFSAHPDVVFDVAHNVEKAEALVAALRESFPGAGSTTSLRSARARMRAGFWKSWRSCRRRSRLRRSQHPDAARFDRSGWR